MIAIPQMTKVNGLLDGAIEDSKAKNILAHIHIILQSVISKATRIVAAERSFVQALSWICFAGSGTTGKVAAQLRRDYIMIELKPEYIEMAKKRIAEGETGVPVKEQRQGQMALFEKGE